MFLTIRQGGCSGRNSQWNKQSTVYKCLFVGWISPLIIALILYFATLVSVASVVKAMVHQGINEYTGKGIYFVDHANYS